MNANNSNLDHLTQGSEQQMDAIAKLTLVSLIWSLSGLSNHNPSKENSTSTTSDIQVDLSNLKHP